MSKAESLKKLCNFEGIINALAIDQRGALKRMLGDNATINTIESFKEKVSKYLTPFSSAILLDPEYGLPAAKQRDTNAGLILAYEKTGYDKTLPGRYPDLIDNQSVKRLKEQGADAVKILLYYDVDEGTEVNDRKEAFIERVGSEAVAEGLPFFLEIVTYDAREPDNERGFAKQKPHKVIESMKRFSAPRYAVDVLKVEVPVNMNYVEGFSDKDPVYTRAEAAGYFKEQSDATSLPFIFLSAGVSNDMFLKTLKFAKKAGSTFNGVLCGRATWAKGVDTAKDKGDDATIEWLRTEGKDNMDKLAKCLQKTATPLSVCTPR